MSEKITKRLIDSFEFDPSVSKDIRWDSDISGFGVRIYESGKKSFILSYRQDGNKRLYTIGQYGNITVEQARDLAKKKLGEVADGKDPLLIRQASRKKNEWTVKKAFADFLKRYAQVHNDYWTETRRIFEKDVIPAIGKKPIDEVTKNDIIKILDKVTARGSGIMANRTLAALRKFFNWCIERDLIKFSPAFKISAPAKNISRDRVLHDHELVEIWKACDEIGYPFGHFIKFLMLTGQRRGETSLMTWTQVDLKKSIWTIPKENTKTDKQHIILLTKLAITVLQDCIKLGDYVFTSSGVNPFDNISRGKRELDRILKEKSKLTNSFIFSEWKIHDLRRTVASGMAKLAISPHIIEKVLNHSSGIISGVAAVYNRHQYTQEVGEALELWNNYLEDLFKRDRDKPDFINPNN